MRVQSLANNCNRIETFRDLQLYANPNPGEYINVRINTMIDKKRPGREPRLKQDSNPWPQNRIKPCPFFSLVKSALRQNLTDGFVRLLKSRLARRNSNNEDILALKIKPKSAWKLLSRKHWWVFPHYEALEVGIKEISLIRLSMTVLYRYARQNLSLSLTWSDGTR